MRDCGGSWGNLACEHCAHVHGKQGRWGNRSDDFTSDDTTIRRATVTSFDEHRRSSQARLLEKRTASIVVQQDIWFERVLRYEFN
jgi:hypothetical protein